MAPVSDWTDFGETATFEVLTLQPDLRGPSYGSSFRPDGRTFEGLPLKQGASEAYAMGYQSTKVVWKILADLPLLVDEKNQVRSPQTGKIDLNNVVSYPSEELGVLVGEHTT